jgi:hypothetical protein
MPFLKAYTSGRLVHADGTEEREFGHSQCHKVLQRSPEKNAQPNYCTRVLSPSCGWRAKTESYYTTAFEMRLTVLRALGEYPTILESHG